MITLKLAVRGVLKNMDSPDGPTKDLQPEVFLFLVVWSGPYSGSFITGKSERYSRYLIQRIKKHLNKEVHQVVSISEFFSTPISGRNTYCTTLFNSPSLLYQDYTMKNFIIGAVLLFIAGGVSAQVETEENKTGETGFIEFPDVDAAFPGGSNALRHFIVNNVKYPDKAMRKNIQGKVYVSFVVERDGSITDIKIKKRAHHLLNKEAIRLVSQMPLWSPGMVKNKPVRTRCSLPITFVLTQ